MPESLEIIFNQSSIFHPSNSTDYSILRSENAAQEQCVIDRLLNQTEVTVFHRLQSADDFDEVQRKGIQRNYKVQTPGGVWYNAYFNLLYPQQLDNNNIAVTLNNGDRKLRIYDNRTAKGLSLPQLIEDGYDGSIETAGVGVPVGQTYMLRLFDGTMLKGKFKKTVELNSEATYVK